MKKIIIILLILGLGGVAFFGYKYIQNRKEEERIAKIKEGWYIEIITEELNIREKGSKNSKILASALKGDIYKVLDVEVLGKNTFWYKIEYEEGKLGFVYNTKSLNYLNDYNNPKDIASPTLKFNENIYYVNTIEDINYKHLEVWDDKPGYEITHKVFHEVGVDINGKNINQYWIQYTVTDKVGNSISKVQKIVFNTNPSEDLVYDFDELER